MRASICCCLVLLVVSGCAGSQRRGGERVAEPRPLWEFKEMTVTKEQAKEIAIKEIADRRPNTKASQVSAHLSVVADQVNSHGERLSKKGERPMWNVSPSGVGDVSWQVTIDAVSGEVVFAYVIDG
ncbi:MAG: hypothetical protein AAF581_13085 [Planctomycetota bacterium]